MYQKLQDWGTTPQDSNEVRFKKFALLIISVFTSVCGLIWGLLYYWLYGFRLHAVLPWSFSVIVGIAIVLFVKYKKFELLSLSYLFCILFITIALQISLGGLIPSGAVFFWSVMAPIGALIFQRRQAVWWLLLYIAMVVCCILWDNTFAHWAVTPTNFTKKLFFLMNILGPSLAIFFGMRYFVDAFYRENNIIQAFNKELITKNEIIALQNKEVLEQKEEIQHINEELQTTLAQVQQYSNVIENKNKHITASIQYAQRIQQAILPLPEEIAKHLPENFILFKPRDIVSGDFYYFHEQAGKILLATIDCTGHGVPGAFMTMIGYEILNGVIVNNRVWSPELILMELHKSIRKALKQAETNNNDGMDLSFIVLDRQAGKMEFAGAKNPILYIQNNEIFEIKADKMPIGGKQQEAERIFTKHEISLNTPTTVYLFSDGYQDQFGGEKRQKYRLARMKELFLANHDKSLDEQKEIYNQTIEAWMNMGAEKQIDDILIVCIRV